MESVGALAHGAVDHARLAEAAAAGAPPQDLDAEAVVHDLGERDDAADRRTLGVEVGDHALVYDGGSRG